MKFRESDQNQIIAAGRVMNRGDYLQQLFAEGQLVRIAKRLAAEVDARQPEESNHAPMIQAQVERRRTESVAGPQVPV